MLTQTNLVYSMKSRNWKKEGNKTKFILLPEAKQPENPNEDDYGKNSEWSNTTF